MHNICWNKSYRSRTAKEVLVIEKFNLICPFKKKWKRQKAKDNPTHIWINENVDPKWMRIKVEQIVDKNQTSKNTQNSPIHSIGQGDITLYLVEPVICSFDLILALYFIYFIAHIDVLW